MISYPRSGEIPRPKHEEMSTSKEILRYFEEIESEIIMKSFGSRVTD